MVSSERLFFFFFFGALGAAQCECAGWIRDRKELQGIFRSLRPNLLPAKIFQVRNYSLCHQVASVKNQNNMGQRKQAG